MLNSLVLILLVAASQNIGSSDAKAVHHDAHVEIVGGQEAVPHEAPYVVSISIYKISKDTGDWAWFNCGATLLSQNYLLTAAHCINGGKQWKANLGRHDLSKTESGALEKDGARYVIAGGSYSIENDAAILRFPEAIDYTDHIQPVKLVSRADANKDFASEYGTAYGWGRTSTNGTVSSVLKKENLLVIGQKFCRQESDHIYDTNTCTKAPAGQGVCFGDSGGPLMVNGFQFGIMSYLGTRNASSACGNGNPDVYAWVGKFLDFIEQNSDVVIN